MAKLWGGRFSKDSDKLMEDFHSSISFDQKLYYWDIQGSIAHATMLGNVGVITKEEAATLVAGLREILEEIEAGKVHPHEHGSPAHGEGRRRRQKAPHRP